MCIRDSKFTLVYYPSENNSTNKTLKLYLRHYNADDKATSSTSLQNSDIPSIFYYAYDLRDVFTRYAMAVGSSEYPSSIVVEYVVNPNGLDLSLIHISEPTRQAEISYAVFCLKKKNKQKT